MTPPDQVDRLADRERPSEQQRTQHNEDPTPAYPVEWNSHGLSLSAQRLLVERSSSSRRVATFTPLEHQRSILSLGSVVVRPQDEGRGMHCRRDAGFSRPAGSTGVWPKSCHGLTVAGHCQRVFAGQSEGRSTFDRVAGSGRGRGLIERMSFRMARGAVCSLTMRAEAN